MPERVTQSSSSPKEKGPVKISWLTLLDTGTPEGLISGGFEPQIRGSRVKVTVPESVSPYLLPSAPHILMGILGLKVDEIVFLNESGQIMMAYFSYAEPYLLARS